MLGNDKLFDVLEKECKDENVKKFIKEIFQFEMGEPGQYKNEYRSRIEKYAERGNKKDENKLSENPKL